MSHLQKYLDKYRLDVEENYEVQPTTNTKKPVKDGEADFRKLHTIEVIPDRAGNGDAVFKGTLPKFDRGAHRMGYDSERSASVYEEVEPLEELSTDLLRRYVKSAEGQSQALAHKRGRKSAADQALRGKRIAGTVKAGKILAKRSKEDLSNAISANKDAFKSAVHEHLTKHGFHIIASHPGADTYGKTIIHPVGTSFISVKHDHASDYPSLESSTGQRHSAAHHWGSDRPKPDHKAHVADFVKNIHERDKRDHDDSIRNYEYHAGKR